MLSFCLKCRKKTESKIGGLQKQKKEKQCFYQPVKCVIAKNRNLSKYRKLVGY